MKTTDRPFRISSLYLLLTALTLALAATIPSNAQMSPNANSPLYSPTTPFAGRPRGGEAHCAATIPLSPFYLRLHHCIDAIRGLSNDAAHGLFHIGDPFDEFSLPVSKTKNFCEVTVEMNSLAVRDTTSWTEIRQEAQLLNAQCQSRYGYRYKGGWILVGERSEIKIRLNWPGTPLLRTDASATAVSMRGNGTGGRDVEELVGSVVGIS